MTSDRGHEHVENATIEVGQAELYISPGARRAAHRLAVSLVILFIVVIGLLAASFLFTNGQVHQVRTNSAGIQQQNEMLRNQVRADCGLDADLAGLPLATLPDGHPSELAVRIISDFRGAWHRKGCPGKLPPASPSYAAGARYYRLPVN